MYCPLPDEETALRVIGTAGHVDHGKSTLITALTGIDPDRLREEKERGMTIDLGFAWLTLPSGQEVSIVDVPGHERFIKNMLAGVGGIDIALLVVAADESIMPQTRQPMYMKKTKVCISSESATRYSICASQPPWKAATSSAAISGVGCQERVIS